jgi:hypothetical protein
MDAFTAHYEKIQFLEQYYTRILCQDCIAAIEEDEAPIKCCTRCGNPDVADKGLAKERDVAVLTGGIDEDWLCPDCVDELGRMDDQLREMKKKEREMRQREREEKLAAMKANRKPRARAPKPIRPAQSIDLIEGWMVPLKLIGMSVVAPSGPLMFEALAASGRRLVPAKYAKIRMRRAVVEANLLLSSSQWSEFRE